MGSRTPPVSENIKAAQAEAGLTTEELALKAGVGLRILYRWRGGQTIPSYDNLCRLAEALERTPDYFYRGEEKAA